jgi:predicted Zn-dependent peptidase
VYQKSTLENGIRVVTETMPEVRSVAIGILVAAGPVEEPAEKAGLAHLIEHVMFHGTSSRDALQIAQFMDVGGGSIGAFTSRDYVCYFASVLDEYRTYALDLMGDILLNSIYPIDKFDREKEVILREIAGAMDSPFERANMLVKAGAWPDHPLGRPILGMPETVCRLTREDAIYFVHQNYLPQRFIVAAAGNLDHQDFTAQVRDAFWRLQGVDKPEPGSPPQPRSGVHIEHAPLSQAYFCLGMQAHPYTYPDRYKVHLLNAVLGGGISSRLFREMRDERGLVYQIDSEYHAYRDGGLLVFEGSTAPEYLNQVLALTFTELQDLREGSKPVNDEELWKAKMHLRGQHLLATESTSTRMSRLATQEFYFGRHIPPDEILNEIEEVETHSFNLAAQELLDRALGNVTIAVVGPGSHEHYDEASLGEILESLTPHPELERSM